MSHINLGASQSPTSSISQHSTQWSSSLAQLAQNFIFVLASHNSTIQPIHIVKLYHTTSIVIFSTPSTLKPCNHIYLQSSTYTNKTCQTSKLCLLAGTVEYDGHLVWHLPDTWLAAPVRWMLGKSSMGTNFRTALTMNMRTSKVVYQRDRAMDFPSWMPVLPPVVKVFVGAPAPLMSTILGL